MSESAAERGGSRTTEAGPAKAPPDHPEQATSVATAPGGPPTTTQKTPQTPQKTPPSSPGSSPAPAQSRRRVWHKVAGDRTKNLSRQAKLAYGLGGVILAIALWQVLASTGSINTLIYSSPWKVLQAGRTLQNNGALDTALVQSAKLFGTGFGIALVIGLVGGVIIGWYRRLGAILDPLVSIVYAAPRIALVPVVIVAAGIGFKAQLITVVLTAVFPIMINVQAGVASADRNLIQVARGYLGTNFDVLRTVALPGAVPHIVSGVRQGITQGLIGVVVAEYLIGSQGVGGLIVSSGQSLDDSSAFVGVIIMSLAAVILTMLLRWVERRLSHWR
jgi:ABC-type nitrate/sulfonate/bicarbonate transport system permease component